MALDSIQITGLAELQQALQDLAVNVEKNCLRGALRAGQKVILAEAKRTSAFADDTGALRASLRITTNSRAGRVSAIVKAGGKKAFYAHMVEFGTRPHDIEAKPGHALAFGGGAVHSVRHPGARRRPYMRPAMDTQSQAALEQFANYLRDRIDKELAKVPGPENY